MLLRLNPLAALSAAALLLAGCGGGGGEPSATTSLAPTEGRQYALVANIPGR